MTKNNSMTLQIHYYCRVEYKKAAEIKEIFDKHSHTLGDISKNNNYYQILKCIGTLKKQDIQSIVKYQKALKKNFKKIETFNRFLEEAKGSFRDQISIAMSMFYFNNIIYSRYIARLINESKIKRSGSFPDELKYNLYEIAYYLINNPEKEFNFLTTDLKKIKSFKSVAKFLSEVLRINEWNKTTDDVKEILIKIRDEAEEYHIENVQNKMNDLPKQQIKNGISEWELALNPLSINFKIKHTQPKEIQLTCFFSNDISRVELEAIQSHAIISITDPQTLEPSAREAKAIKSIKLTKQSAEEDLYFLSDLNHHLSENYFSVIYCNKEFKIITQNCKNFRLVLEDIRNKLIQKNEKLLQENSTDNISNLAYSFLQD